MPRPDEPKRQSVLEEIRRNIEAEQNPVQLTESASDDTDRVLRDLENKLDRTRDSDE